MATIVSLPSGAPNRPTHSCIRCADRKVKCDRQKPCSACVKHQVDCVFNLSQPSQKRQRRVKNQVLADRLRLYERLLSEQGVDLSKLSNAPASMPSRASSQTVSVATEEPQLHIQSDQPEPNRIIDQAQVVHSQGRSKFVDNSLWTRLVEEFPDPEDALEDISNNESDLESSDNDLGFVFSLSQPSTRVLHPPPERIDQLWQVFIENVDPLTKIVHIPTLRPAIQKAIRNIETIPRGFEALMFSIYSTAVMSLKNDECELMFHEPRKTLLSRYISATKAALSRAKFMGTISLVVLQALVLHLLSVRDIYEPRALWSLTGVAVRIAQSMGLERDGVFLGLPPFESEMRRRVWWQLKSHDFRIAELCGLAKFRDLSMDAESTQWPTNVNDDCLYPGMPPIVTESNKLTDMVFVSVRHEFMKFAAGRVARFRQLGKKSNQWDLRVSGNDKIEIDEALTEVKNILETKYLRYCDPSQPLHLMTMLAARHFLNVIRFLTHHPRKWTSIQETPPSERQLVWDVSIKLLERHNMVQSNPQLKQFSWHAQYLMQWHAFIHLLDTLRADPLITDAEKVWQLIGDTYKNNPDMIFDTKKAIHVAVGNLCLKAYRDREAALRNQNICPPPPPEFILQLNQQRESAEAKIQVRKTKNNEHENPVSHGLESARDVDLSLDASILHSSNILDSTHLQQSTISGPLSLSEPNGATEDDPFWFVNDCFDSQMSNLNDMSMDPNLVLTENDNSENKSLQNITWEQWDSWLAESNLIRPQSSSWIKRAGT